MTFTVLLVWLLMGLAGSALFMEFGYRRDGVPITVGTLCFFALKSLLGPAVLLAAILIFTPELVHSWSIFNRVVIPPRKK